MEKTINSICHSLGGKAVIEANPIKIVSGLESGLTRKLLQVLVVAAVKHNDTLKESKNYQSDRLKSEENPSIDDSGKQNEYDSLIIKNNPTDDAEKDEDDKPTEKNAFKDEEIGTHTTINCEQMNTEDDIMTVPDEDVQDSKQNDLQFDDFGQAVQELDASQEKLIKLKEHSPHTEGNHFVVNVEQRIECESK